ncbi:MAG: hypothetical protein IT219_02750 [Bacteroidales bacterium]|nr:hypothetical protein [Bacteroidales bacterium]
MKQFIVFMLITVLAMLGCKKDPYMNFGFDCGFHKLSSGLVIADVSQSDNTVYLAGNISVTEGKLEVNLIGPNQSVIYSKTLIAPVEVHINEIFDACPGYWKLKYKSWDGDGSIDLHLYK